MRKLSVAASKNYDILIGNGLLSQLGGYVKTLEKIQTVALVSETTVYPLFGQVAEKSLADAGFQVKSFVFPAGEASKCADTYMKLLAFLARNHLTRTDAKAMLVACPETWLCFSLCVPEGYQLVDLFGALL